MTTPMTETGGGRMLLRERAGFEPAGGVSLLQCTGALNLSATALPQRTFAAALLCLLLSGCLGNPPPPVSAIPTTAAACEAMRSAFPITYSGKSDTAETVRQVRAANARFVAACP